MPAPRELKPNSNATMAPPMNEPNIGIRLKTPVMRPNGKAKPGVMPKIRQMINTAIAVAQALMRPTVTALETYCETVWASLCNMALVRLTLSVGRKLSQNCFVRLGPSVRIKKASTSERMITAMALPTEVIELVRILPRSATKAFEKLFTTCMS